MIIYGGIAEFISCIYPDGGDIVGVTLVKLGAADFNFNVCLLTGLFDNRFYDFAVFDSVKASFGRLTAPVAHVFAIELNAVGKL